ncbi:hypothetical protein HK405_009020, partial [Cladochytrium tenue]
MADEGGPPLQPPRPSRKHTRDDDDDDDDYSRGDCRVDSSSSACHAPRPMMFRASKRSRLAEADSTHFAPCAPQQSLPPPSPICPDASQPRFVAPLPQLAQLPSDLRLQLDRLCSNLGSPLTVRGLACSLLAAGASGLQLDLGVRAAAASGSLNTQPSSHEADSEAAMACLAVASVWAAERVSAAITATTAAIGPAPPPHRLHELVTLSSCTWRVRDKAGFLSDLAADAARLVTAAAELQGCTGGLATAAAVVVPTSRALAVAAASAARVIAGARTVLCGPSTAAAAPPLLLPPPADRPDRRAYAASLGRFAALLAWAARADNGTDGTAVIATEDTPDADGASCLAAAFFVFCQADLAARGTPAAALERLQLGYSPAPAPTGDDDLDGWARALRAALAARHGVRGWGMETDNAVRRALTSAGLMAPAPHGGDEGSRGGAGGGGWWGRTAGLLQLDTPAGVARAVAAMEQQLASAVGAGGGGDGGGALGEVDARQFFEDWQPFTFATPRRVVKTGSAGGNRGDQGLRQQRLKNLRSFFDRASVFD